MIGNNDVKSYENSEQGRHAYLTYLQKGYTNEQPIVIGNGSKILEKARRKRATTRTYQNAPLQEGTEYALFVRVFYDDDEVSDNMCDRHTFRYYPPDSWKWSWIYVNVKSWCTANTIIIV